MVKVGIVGCGIAARGHMKAYIKIPDVSIVGIYDIDSNRVQAFQNEFNVEVLTLEELISTADVVDIGTPTFSHLELVEMVAKGGKDIICETPIARTIEDADRIIDICKTNNVRLIPIHVLGSTGPYASVRKKMENENLIRSGIIRISRKNDGIPDSAGNWRGDFNLSGGVILDCLIQDIAFLIKNIGSIIRVSCHTSRKDKDFHGEYALISLRFKNGSIAHLDGSWIENVRGKDEFEFAYKGGLATYSKQLSTPLYINTNKKNYAQSPLHDDKYDTGLIEIVKMLEIKGEKEPKAALIVAYDALRAALAALESASTGEVVILEQQDLGVKL